MLKLFTRIKNSFLLLRGRYSLTHGFVQLFIAFDQLLNVLFNPFSKETWADETISSRAGRLGHRNPYKIYRMLIDALFAWQGPDHCRRAHAKELVRYQFPPSMRKPGCTLPPAGWYCTREPGHEGPCAAWPIAPENEEPK